MQLHHARGKRLYLTAEERAAFLAAAKATRLARTLCGVPHATGCRVSEALALTPEQVDLTGKVLVFESLKKRCRGVYRAVPVPPRLLTSSTSCTASGRPRRCPIGAGGARSNSTSCAVGHPPPPITGGEGHTG